MHAQFELLHPFKDGNGRIGRLLIPLFLYSKQRLSSPMFYLSAFLEANRGEYYHRLDAISSQNDWTGWVAFFLRGVVEQSEQNLIRTRDIMQLYEVTKKSIRDITHSQYSAQIVDALFDKPIFRVSDICTKTGMPKPTAHSILRQLQEQGLITQLREGAGRRAAILAFPSLLNVSEGKTVIENWGQRKN
jgi:Fic family protein